MLFSSNGVTVNNTAHSSKEESYMAMLHYYLIQQSKGDHALAARMFGVANEITLDLEMSKLSL